MSITGKGKLVRDNIPEVIEDDGKTPVTRVLSDIEYRDSLDEKLKEEVGEYFESKTSEELGDIIDVVHAISECDGVSVSELEEIRKKKLGEKGGFVRKIFLKEAREK